LFVIGGVAALLWCVFIVADAYIGQRLARETLESRSRETTSSPASSSAPSTVAAGARPKLIRGTPLAELSIPRVGLSAVVLHGTDAHTLRLGLGHVENTPLPGESGNVAIAGHRDSFFRPLRNVQVGDDILLDTPEERVHYRVSSFRVVDSYEVSVVAPTRDDMLTLVTCYPFWFIGEAPDRFVVRAARVEEPAAAASRSAALSTTEPNRENVVDGVPTGSDDGVAIGSEAGATQSNRPLGAGMRPSGHGSRSSQLASITLGVRGADDDDALVRKAVERFRLTYNAPLSRHPEAAPDGLMTFRFCEVAIDGTTATATCNAAPASPESQASPIWTVGLRRIDGGWTIRSVAMR
jgi:sortase A